MDKRYCQKLSDLWGYYYRAGYPVMIIGRMAELRLGQLTGDKG